MGKWMVRGSFVLLFCVILSTNSLNAETRKETALSYIDLGDKLAHEGEFDRAIRSYNIALQFVPDFAPAFFHRALAWEAQGDVSKAIADYTTTVEIAPGWTTAFYNRGNLRLSSDDVDGALSDFNKVLEG